MVYVPLRWTRGGDMVCHGAAVGWLSVVADLSEELGWQLSHVDRVRYATALAALLPGHADVYTMRRTCQYYHQDHELVEALVQQAHPHHDRVWDGWSTQAAQILYKANVVPFQNSVLEAEDLAQVALIEIAQSLHRFRYQSRFSTWAHTVVVQAARRIIRDSRAKKRPQPQHVASFDASPGFDVPIAEAVQPESVAYAQSLATLVETILATSGDARLASIFVMHAIHDRSALEISRVVQLHPSRVRSLLDKARTILQDHPALQSWITDDPPARCA